ncbi:MAG: hypothetical protein KGM99_05320 [Burkholderiales bacterium]|nr:hypothetical protein [Burkholderiales bacterium]
MKRIGFLIILVVLVMTGYDRVMHSIEKGNASRADAQMEKIAQEMDAKTPLVGPVITINEVSYAQHMLRFSGVVTSSAPTAEAKAEFEKAAHSMYCSGKLASHHVSVEYEVLGPPRSLDDLTREKWVTSVRPENC